MGTVLGDWVKIGLCATTFIVVMKAITTALNLGPVSKLFLAA